MVKYTIKRLKRLKMENKNVLTAFQQSHGMNTKHESTNIKSIAYIVKNMFIVFIAYNIKNTYNAKNAFGCNSEKINNLLWRIFPKK